MSRLNNQAWKILRQEVERCTANNDLAGEVQRDIVLKRLEKLRSQSGNPANYQELYQIISDIFPHVSEKALKKAAKVNQGKGKIPKLIGVSLASLVGLGGVIWLVNLPYPIIRRPIAKTAPILLLPSYLNMDRNYREAIAHVQQAEQLVNQATSMADIELGAEKVQLAQKNLDQLPVWFLGYEPQRYCTFFQCSWEFTIDEFKAARASVGRMEAVIFQEKNAMQTLEKAETSLQQAKTDYQQAITPETQQTALNNWQKSLDELTQLPPNTLAEKIAKTKLTGYQRDFQQVSGTIAGNNQTNTLISAAQQFALAAVKMAETPPHPVATWEQAESLWQQAIARLEAISLDASGYLQAQTLLAEYKSNLGNIQIRRQTEAESVQAYTQAQQNIEQLLASLPKNGKVVDSSPLMAKLQSIINQLEKVQSGTTIYSKAQELLVGAKKKMDELR